jgi:hypothetical protein
VTHHEVLFTHIVRNTGVVVVVLPGHNQDGRVLASVLEPALCLSDILTYAIPRWGFDQVQLKAGLLRCLQAYPHRKVIVYAEGVGALDAMALLRAYPELRVWHLILNAGISGKDDLVRPWLGLGNVPRWALTTNYLHGWQERQLQRGVGSGSATDLSPVIRSHRESMLITRAQIRGQLRRIATTPPTYPGELDGRVRMLTYLGAPDSTKMMAAEDPVVLLQQASKSWEASTGLASTAFSVRFAPPYWRDQDGHTHHACTPEQPRFPLLALRGAIEAATQQR